MGTLRFRFLGLGLCGGGTRDRLYPAFASCMPWACSELEDVGSPAAPLPLCGGKAKGISVAMSNLNIFQRLFYIVLTHDAN